MLPLGDGTSLLFTADLLTEGVHFLRAATSARELGRKSLAVNLSDIAAMGARPVATLLSLALPADAEDAWTAEFTEGYRELSARYGAALVGGDTTRSAGGITINVTAIGRAPDAHVKRRDAAREGDIVFVAGELGASGAGLRDILAGRYDTPLAAVHRNPEPQVGEGAWLGARSEVHAMMDLSDGLASDLGHILDRSSAGAEVELLIPFAPRGPTCASTAACGGEDQVAHCRSVRRRPSGRLPRPLRLAAAIRWVASLPRLASSGPATGVPSRLTGTASNTSDSGTETASAPRSSETGPLKKRKTDGNFPAGIIETPCPKTAPHAFIRKSAGRTEIRRERE